MSHGRRHVDVTFKLRRKTAAEWTEQNPVLAEGEPANEKDTGRLKVGDGVSPWNLLNYSVPTSLLRQLVAEAVALSGGTPAPDSPTSPEDDGTSFLLLYENAKV